ncbi:MULTISPECIES: tetratricopeptide repeat protein [unclassified Streptomyces]|uniref:tetratricopeptide repeat protein n=1 Tax=unclassified Streptomyces TaxID=2593676 RepID=UPI0013707095|nr:ATP-binding protein [Streptomyces sp. ScaeMP-e83]MYR92363.1 tetratricopeptide repeat protein [Streptomyces sp. SID4937]
MGDIKHFVWPEESVSDNRVSWCVGALRKELPERVDRIRSGVCAIDLPRGSLDYFRFGDAVRQAALQRGRERFQKLNVAMDEWPHGEALQGLTGAGFDVRRAELWAEWRKAVLLRLEAAYSAEEEEWLIKETGELSRRLPRDQQILRFLLLARASTLSARARTDIVKEWRQKFGQPSDPLLIETIGRLRRTGRRTGSRPSAHLVPRQLPPIDRGLIGREDQLAEFSRIVLRQHANGRGTLIALTGMPGVGKSTLARHLAQLVEHRFPDGVLCADMRGVAGGATGAPADPEQLLDRFLADLGVRTKASGLEGKSAALRSVLATRSVLMVLDDVADMDQVLPLLPGAGTCAVIVTSRGSLSDLRARKEVCMRRIDLLESRAATEILNDKIASADRPRTAGLVAELVELCGRLPLALVVIAKRIEGRPPDGIRALVAQLGEDRRKLDALHLSTHDLSVRLALDCSVRALSPEARCLLWQLAIHPGPGISWSATMDLGRVGAGGDVDRAVEELMEANLVQLVFERYVLHDLVRVYARHPADSKDGPGQMLEDATVRQLLEHQLQNVRACDRVIDRHRELPIGDAEGVTVIDLRGEEEAMAYLDAEYEAAMRGIELAQRKNLTRYIWLLPMALVTYQWRRNRHAAAERVLEDAVDAAQKAGSPGDRAMVHRMLAGSQMRRGAVDVPVRHLQQAVCLSEQEGGEAGGLSLARSLHMRAIVLRRQGDLAAAEGDYRRARDMFRVLRDDVGEAAALNGLGTLHHDHRRYDDALRECAEALRIFGTTADVNGKANVLVTLGKIHLSRSERDEALAVYRSAISIYRELGYWPNEASTLRCYADVLLTLGDSRGAVKALERAAVLLEMMGGEGLRDVIDLLGNLR